MTTDFLEPHLDLLREEYVLVQAWKKASGFIRYHNWYADTLELDMASADLPRFLSKLAEQLRSPERWGNDALRIVLAPKSYQWQVNQDEGRNLWRPVIKGITASKLRPLAHVSLKDQVAATALMLCLANRVETLQGDSRALVDNLANRRDVVSYGNRLFCEKVGTALRHPWGSAKLYRAYYEDYQRFLARPGVVAASRNILGGYRVVVVHSDLRQFYDRVRPSLLMDRLSEIARPTDDPQFFALAERLLNWSWHTKDSKAAAEYSRMADLPSFSQVALPQGLVAAGFFANVALLKFDQQLRGQLETEIRPNIRLEDICRYVDDLRIVLTVDSDKSLSEIEEVISQWLQELLDDTAPGLQPSADKTKATVFQTDERPMVFQSRQMTRIQHAVSGGFDAIAGKAILEAVQGLVRSQQRYSAKRTEDQNWPFSPVPDVRDETVARFAAARFRTTYRSLRPLLEHGDTSLNNQLDLEKDSSSIHSRMPTQFELDNDARAFALGLIESWIEDPSNVRLLRIGLDLWPAADVLKAVLDLLQPFTEKGRLRRASRFVAWYCLAEIFRAGATETGLTPEQESLPGSVDLARYYAVLEEEALRLLKGSLTYVPWYLKQQLLLFLAVRRTKDLVIESLKTTPEILHYIDLIKFPNKERAKLSSTNWAIFAILLRRAFGGVHVAVDVAIRDMNAATVEQIAERDPSFALEILKVRPDLVDRISPRLRDDLSLNPKVGSEEWESLPHVVLQPKPNSGFRNELTLLRFASRFLVALDSVGGVSVIVPSDVLIKVAAGGDDASPCEVTDVKIIPSRVAPEGSMYQPPSWCPADERWRFQLGYLLRFVLAAHADFTKVVRPSHWKEEVATYRSPESHWYQRLYGLFNRQAAFGDDWLPISDWIEQFLLSLLKWPGCRTSEAFDWIWMGPEKARKHIEARIVELSTFQGKSTGTLMLEMPAPLPGKLPGPRPLRACIVQTIIPSGTDFNSADLSFSAPPIRKAHRNHLSAALEAIVRMLDLRETHTNRERRLDWLILPELSVHPKDVETCLVPFVRAHRTIVLAGLTYQQLFSGQPMVNSAIWILPVWSPAHGLQVVVRRQGKRYLSPEEEKFNIGGSMLKGFRPCQWIVGYEWSNLTQDSPLKLTSSVCYDATDIRLAADLRQHSDVFAVLALNKDVNTFDQMALALHYHMFQMVIVANNGRYGGSNAYAPYKESYVRQVFHLHGQPQASIAFLEIDDIKTFIARQTEAKSLLATSGTTLQQSVWKFPPAGM